MSIKNTVIRECVSIAKNHVHIHPEFRCFIHYSFIIQDNRIVEWGINRRHSPPKYMGYPSHSKLHSEVVAYKRAKGLLNKSKKFGIINLRFSRRGKLRNSYPCPCCCRFLNEIGCQDIMFSTNAGISRMQKSVL